MLYSWKCNNTYPRFFYIKGMLYLYVHCYNVSFFCGGSVFWFGLAGTAELMMVIHTKIRNAMLKVWMILFLYGMMCKYYIKTTIVELRYFILWVSFGAAECDCVFYILYIHDFTFLNRFYIYDYVFLGYKHISIYILLHYTENV